MQHKAEAFRTRRSEVEGLLLHPGHGKHPQRYRGHCSRNDEFC